MFTFDRNLQIQCLCFCTLNVLSFEGGTPDLILAEAKKKKKERQARTQPSRTEGTQAAVQPSALSADAPARLSGLLGYLLLSPVCSWFPPPVQRTGCVPCPQNWMGLLNLGPNYPLKTFVLVGPGSGPVLPLGAHVQSVSPATTVGSLHLLPSRSACGADRPPLLVPRSPTKGARTDAAITALGGGVPPNRRAQELGRGTRSLLSRPRQPRARQRLLSWAATV